MSLWSLKAIDDGLEFGDDDYSRDELLEQKARWYEEQDFPCGNAKPAENPAPCFNSYWVFAFHSAVSKGGMRDFSGAYPSFETALSRTLEESEILSKDGGPTHYQIVDIRCPKRFFLTRAPELRASDTKFEREMGFHPGGEIPDRWIEE